MPYIEIGDFRSGLDLRRPALVAPAGTLQKLVNAHLTPGGDIEKRFAFDPVYACPSGSFGIAGFGSTVYLFRQAAPAPAPAPSPAPPPPAALSTRSLVGGNLSVTVLDLTMPAGVTAASLVDWDMFNGEIYSVIKGSDGKFYHFYGTTYVSEINKLYDPAPHNIRTFKGKVYGITPDKLVFSALDSPLIWDPALTGTGAPAGSTSAGQGFIILSSYLGSADYLTGLEVYYDQLAVASRYSTQIWEVDADPKNNNLRQTLRSAGTVAPNSMLGFGSGDVLYLHDSGIRSLRAKDSSNAAAVSDIGSPLDPIIQKLIRSRPDDPYIQNAFSLVEPNTGRFWLCFRDRVFILSYYPGPKVTAWSEYTPEFPIDGGITARGQVVLRSGDELYVYGGVDGLTYDSCEVTIETPYLSVEKPATFKGFVAVDFAAWGVWTAEASFDPNHPDAKDPVCTVSEPTLGSAGSVALQGAGTHVALTVKCKTPGAAMLSSLFVHYVTSGKAD